MITNIESFTEQEDADRLQSVDKRFAQSIKIAKATNEFQGSLEEPDDTRGRDKFRALFNEFVIGGRYLSEQQYKIPQTGTSPRDEEFFKTDEFSNLIKENGVSTDDARALMEQRVGNAKEFFSAMGKQERYNKDQEVLKDMSPLSLVASGIGISIFDPSSWATGAIVSKPFQMLYTGTKVGKYSLLGLRGAEGASTAGLINYATELSNQEAAGVKDGGKLLELTSYGAAFGLALPVLPSAITQISQGAYRSRGAQIAKEYIQTNPVTASLRKYLSLGAGEQTKWQSTNPLTQELSWSIAPSTGVRRNADGTPIIQKTTAMDLKKQYAERPFKQASEGLEQRAKEFGGGATGWAKASRVDGNEISRIVGEAEQTYGKQIAELTQRESLDIYKKSTGIDELPTEKARAREINKLQKKIDELSNSRAKLEGTTAPSGTKAGLTKRINSSKKKLEELKNKPIEEPEDLFNVVRNELHKQAVKDGRFKLPEHLEYVGKFFKDFSDTATKLKVSGIAGKEGYGYFPVRYNRDFAIAEPSKYKSQIEQALRTDNYNAVRLQRGDITEEDILQQVESFYTRAVNDDIRFKYLDKGVPSGAGSSSKARRVNINRRDFPDLFETDLVDTMGHYAREQGGRNAFIETFNIDPYAKGTTPQQAITKMLDDVAKEGEALGISPKKVKKDVENLRAMLEGVLDVRRIQTDPNTFTNTAVRTLKGLASTMYSAGFVKYNMVEWLSGAVHNGFSKTVKNYLPAMDAVVKDIRGLPTNSPEFEAMRHTILASHSLLGQMFSRLDANELTGRLSFIENGVHQVNNGIRKWSGFNISTDINEVAIAGAGMRKLFGLNPNKLTTNDIDWLSRYGFSKEDLIKLSKNKDIKRDSSGNILDYNVPNWKDGELQSKFSTFLERVSRDAVPVPNASTLHRFQSDVNDPIKSLFFQYTQVPTVLWDKVFLTVADKPTTDAIAGLTMATLGMYTIFKMDDELKVRTGLKDDVSPDKEIFTRAVLSTGFIGVGGMVANAGLSALGIDLPGVSYGGRNDLTSQLTGAAGSVLNNGGDILKAIGNGDAEQAATRINNLNPLNSVPFLGVGIEALGAKTIEEVTNE